MTGRRFARMALFTFMAVSAGSIISKQMMPDLGGDYSETEWRLAPDKRGFATPYDVVGLSEEEWPAWMDRLAATFGSEREKIPLNRLSRG